MQSIYSVVKEFRGCFKGKFWRSTVLLLHLKAGNIFVSIEKFGSHVRKVANESLVAYTDLFVSLVIIPDLIRLANDIETNPGAAVGDNIDSGKTICASHLSSNILSSLSNRQFF